MRHRGLAVTILFAGVFGQTSCGGDDDSAGGGAGTSGSSTNNVKIAETCTAPAACGGDPTGSWKLRTACVTPPDGGFHCSNGLETAHGKASGTLDLGASSFSMSMETDISQCGWIDGSADGASGSVVLSGSTVTLGLTAYAFCVEGDTLWLDDPTVEYPDLQVLEFTRAE